ncbi:MAG: hypothetical protein GX879_10725 [Bacteroidales bacterium]|nr:hypothetical protein [Bacteroidales bacterium]
MKLNKLRILILLLPLFVVFSCKNNATNENIEAYSDIKQKYQKPMLEMNKDMVIIETEMIQGFISRRNWEMQQTGSGLYYQVYKEGEGSFAKSGDKVKFEYKIWLLDGTLAYSSETEGIRELLIGHNDEESGLDEGLRFMKQGGKARFIMQPHLAFGVPGDGYKIPYRAILVYDIELISIN